MSSYRSRLKEGVVPRDEKAGRCLCQTGEFNMLLKRLIDAIWEEEPIDPFRPPGRKPPIRIPDEEGERLIALRDWLRGWDAMNRSEASPVPQSNHTGVPNYSRRWKREKDDPNGYMRTLMYDGSTPGFSVLMRAD